MQTIIAIKLTAPQPPAVIVWNEQMTSKQRLACELSEISLSMPNEDVPNHGLYLPL